MEKPPPPTASQMISERSFSPEVDASVREWVKYKIEKRQGYKPTGLRNFLSQVENNVQKYGAEAVARLIHFCMSNNWQGVIWERIDKTGTRNTEQCSGGYGNIAERLLQEERSDLL